MPEHKELKPAKCKPRVHAKHLNATQQIEKATNQPEENTITKLSMLSSTHWSNIPLIKTKSSFAELMSRIYWHPKIVWNIRDEKSDLSRLAYTFLWNNPQFPERTHGPSSQKPKPPKIPIKLSITLRRKDNSTGKLEKDKQEETWEDAEKDPIERSPQSRVSCEI